MTGVLADGPFVLDWLINVSEKNNSGYGQDAAYHCFKIFFSMIYNL